MQREVRTERLHHIDSMIVHVHEWILVTHLNPRTTCHTWIQSVTFSGASLRPGDASALLLYTVSSDFFIFIFLINLMHLSTRNKELMVEASAETSTEREG